jgi:hypothetical protein
MRSASRPDRYLFSRLACRSGEHRIEHLRNRGETSVAVPPFVVVVKLDLTGKVVAKWRSGDSDFAICFERKMGELSLFTPSRAPFYTSFEMDIRANPKT